MGTVKWSILGTPVSRTIEGDRAGGLSKDPVAGRSPNGLVVIVP